MIIPLEETSKWFLTAEGKVRLELRAPFAYLYEISERVLHQGEIGVDKIKTSEVPSTGLSSDWILDCGR